MANPLACPDPRELERLARGLVAEPDAELLGGHVLGCSSCAERLASLQADDPLVPDLQAALALPTPNDAFADSLVERLAGTPPDDVGVTELAPNRTASLPSQPQLPAVPGYEVLAELGRGGMGVVFKARHLRLNRLVALKMVLGGAYADQQGLVRFLGEAEAVAKLHHANIVQVYDFGQLQDLPYFTMEWVAGGSLADRLRGTPLPPAEAARLLEQVSRGMHHAHQRGIVHRDLKPANVLLSDGIPKVADFGLAKSVAVDISTGSGAVKVVAQAGLTRSGLIMGTPSYMAPEQAAARNREVAAAADIYALGAILYEMLTGRPPFRAESAMETVLQVMHDEPVPPRRLQPKLPVDLETICLKCLAKEPHKRYPSAAALADDLKRYLNDEPIWARPVGRLERTGKWVRRNKALTAFLVALVLLVVGGGAAALWYEFDQVTRAAERDVRQEYLNHEVRTALDEAASKRHELRHLLDDPRAIHVLLSDIDQWRARLKEAKAALRRAQTLADGGEDLLTAQLAEQLRALHKGLDADGENWAVAKELDDVRIEAATLVEGKPDRGRAAKGYPRVFAKLSLSMEHGEPSELAERIVRAPARYALVAALDNWAEATRDKELRARLLEVARRADPHPWRDRFRDVQVWDNLADLKRLADELQPQEQSPQVIVALASRLQARGGDPADMLRRALLHHARDFWLFFHLGDAAKDPVEQEGRFQAALIIRPDSGPAHSNLATALRKKKDIKGAITHFQLALQLAPDDAITHLNFALLLYEQNDRAAALAKCREAVRLDPSFAAAHTMIGVVHYDQKEVDEAIKHFRLAIAANDRYAEAHSNLGSAFRAQRRLKEAVVEYRRSIELEPDDPIAHSNLGNALSQLNDLPGAIAEYRRAVELAPTFAVGYYNLGLALYNNREADEAIPHLQKSIKLDAKFTSPYKTLAYVLLRQGRFAEARQSAAQCLKLLPANHAWRQELQQQIQQCDRLVVGDGKLAAFLETGATPNSIDEQLGLADLCRRYKQYHAAAARLYAGAFAAQPKRADDLVKAHRYNAASSAVLAAAGRSRDPEQPDAKEQIRLRGLALGWLRADLGQLTAQVQAGQAEAVLLLLERLPHWLQNADLASVREPQALTTLPAAEQESWRELWAEADRLLKRARAGMVATTIEGNLTDKERQQVHDLKVEAGKSYVIDMHSTVLDSYLKLLDGQGKVLAEHDDLAPDNPDARLIVTPKESATCRIVATSYEERGRGAYTLTIRAFTK